MPVVCLRAVYGPSVAPQTYFDATEFPHNMEAIWDAHFGFILSERSGCVIIGEWGGWNMGNDAVWQRAFSAYLSRRKISHFYWALNPTSRDTGGLVLADWHTPSSLKLTMLSSMPVTTVGLLHDLGTSRHSHADAAAAAALQHHKHEQHPSA